MRKSLSIMVIIFFQCKQPPHIEKQNEFNMTNDLQGNWKANLKLEEVNYPEIIIKDKNLILTSKGDTLYRYTYHIKKNTIIFKSIFDENFLFKTKYQVDNKKLTFDSLPNKKNKIHFYKVLQ